MDLIRKNPRVGFSAYGCPHHPREGHNHVPARLRDRDGGHRRTRKEKRTALDAITVRYKSLCPRPATSIPPMINRVAIIRRIDMFAHGEIRPRQRGSAQSMNPPPASDLALVTERLRVRLLDRGGSRRFPPYERRSRVMKFAFSRPHSPKPKATRFGPNSGTSGGARLYVLGCEDKTPEVSPDSPGLHGVLTRRSRPAWKSAGGSCPNTGARDTPSKPPAA